MEKKILIINANYYQDISDRLVAGATNYLKENGIDYKVVNVPGALEISSAINSIISNNYSFTVNPTQSSTYYTSYQNAIDSVMITVLDTNLVVEYVTSCNDYFWNDSI